MAQKTTKNVEFAMKNIFFPISSLTNITVLRVLNHMGGWMNKKKPMYIKHKNLSKYIKQEYHPIKMCQYP